MELFLQDHSARVARLLSLLDDEALDGAAEIAPDVGQPRHGEARAIRTDPGFRIEQNPLTCRRTGKTDREVGIDEGPLPEIKHGGGAVAEIRGNHGAHGLRNRRPLDQRPVDPIPDRAGTGHAEAAAGGAHRNTRYKGTAGKVRLLFARLIRSRKFDRLIPYLRWQGQRPGLDLEDCRADHDE